MPTQQAFGELLTAAKKKDTPSRIRITASNPGILNYRDENDLLGVMLFDRIFSLDALGQIAEYFDAHPLAFFPELREPSVSIKIEHLTSENASLKDQVAQLEGEIDQLKKNTPDYLDKSHRHYSPKLEAAIEVWRAIFQNSGKEIPSKAKRIDEWLDKFRPDVANADSITRVVNPTSEK